MIWRVAKEAPLRGHFKQHQYGTVILPFTILRRLDQVLAPTKEAVLKEAQDPLWQGQPSIDVLKNTANQAFANTSPLDLTKIAGAPHDLEANLNAYVAAFTPEARDIFDHFKFASIISALAQANILHNVVTLFASFDLSPERVDNHQMGSIFEELIRRFSETSNETAGEHFTPREVIQLLVELIFAEDRTVLAQTKAPIRSIYDPACGTGGMLSVAEDYLKSINPTASVNVFGQELNPESYAICRADMLIKGQNVEHIHLGNTLSDDKLTGQRFNYMLSNPPYGVDWKSARKAIEDEHKNKGYDGRFGPGLPPISDGSLLFLLTQVAKMKPVSDGGSRIGIVLDGSPLFTGGAGSSSSEIRRYVLEQDLVEAIIALPTEMFFNTNIATYVWVLTNHKPVERRGCVQLIDGSSFWRKMRKSLGFKRREITPEQVGELVALYNQAKPAQRATLVDSTGQETMQIVPEGTEPPQALEGGSVKLAPLSVIVPNKAFGFRQITVERPLYNEDGTVQTGTRGKAKGKPLADSALRDTETIPLNEDIQTWFEREVNPHAPDAWIDESKTKVGYEIPFNRYFYVYEPPRSLKDIDADLQAVTARITALLGGMAS
ncbi:SAM-dependent DNA methyltransferase [Formicincola oecophyllae]|uniref:site-specific DNA-methyltransferase (adenine-specific) n=1 Tax=Formicincola oecophyllae TaxID=2558361 RepID=A0A4Y6U6P5_9PROT|nr:class I SAM-dependent DNA methyltransferase [Formicincola oecophyllae]QDH13033.1 SAM-dependent DNA methyltransferase [Formicincola oecophyllae]